MSHDTCSTSHVPSFYLEPTVTICKCTVCILSNIISAWQKLFSECHRGCFRYWFVSLSYIVCLLFHLLPIQMLLSLCKPVRFQCLSLVITSAWQKLSSQNYSWRCWAWYVLHVYNVSLFKIVCVWHTLCSWGCHPHHCYSSVFVLLDVCLLSLTMLMSGSSLIVEERTYSLVILHVRPLFDNPHSVDVTVTTNTGSS